MQLEKGETIGGRYSLVRPIGEGGMGAVWAALDTQQNELVALKVLRAQAKVPELLRRFLREARAAMAVKHPNVVRIREVVTVDGEPVIVMDFLEGESLAARLDKVRRLPLNEFARIFVAVVSAIGTAHAAGIVHRDLKPDNIFLVRLPDGGEEPRVVDFGIAKLTATEGDAKQSGHLTTTGSVLGTPYYMSPEQVFGDKSIDHRTDVWSLGTIAFECLSGRRPVDGDNIGQLLKVITTGAIPRLEDVVAGLPPDVYELVGRMLSFDRVKRPYDLREVLNVFARHSDQQAQSFGEVTLLPGAESAPGPPVSPTAETLMDPAGVAPAVAVSSRLGSTTGGAAMPVVSGASASQPIRPSRGGRLAAFGILGLTALGFSAVVGVRAMKTGTTASPMMPATASTSAPQVAAGMTVEPTPSSSVHVAVLGSGSASASASVPSAVAPPRPVAGVRRPAPSASASASASLSTTPAANPSVSAKTIPTGAPVATDNPYK